MLDQAEKAKLEERLELAQLIGIAGSEDFSKYKKQVLDEIYPWMVEERKSRARAERDEALREKESLNMKLNNMFSRRVGES